MLKFIACLGLITLRVMGVKEQTVSWVSLFMVIMY
jgi:hypothetical protein